MRAWGKWMMAVAALAMAGCDCYQSTAGDDDDVVAGDGDADSDSDTDADTDADADADGDPDGGRDAGAVDGGREDAGDLDAAVSDAGREDAGPPVGADPLELGVIVGQPHAAIDRYGDATVVWATAEDVIAKRFEDGAWTDDEIIGSGYDPHVDFNAFGEGVAIWRDETGTMYARLWMPGAGWLPQEEIGPTENTQGGAVAIDVDGNVTAMLNESAAWTTRYEPATGWTEATALDPPTASRRAAVAANDSGDLAAVWIRWTRRPEESHLHSSRDVVEWEDVWPIGRDGYIGAPAIAVDGLGNALVAWTQFDINDDGATWAAWQAPGDDFEAPEMLGPPESGEHNLGVAASLDGSGFVTWATPNDVLAAHFDPVGRWGAAVPLDASDGSTELLGGVDVAADEDGGALAGWAQGGHMWWSRFVPDQGWTEAVRLNPDSPLHVRYVDVDVAPDGTAVVAWSNWDQVFQGAQAIWVAVLVR